MDTEREKSEIGRFLGNRSNRRFKGGVWQNRRFDAPSVGKSVLQRLCNALMRLQDGNSRVGFGILPHCMVTG